MEYSKHTYFLKRATSYISNRIKTSNRRTSNFKPLSDGSLTEEVSVETDLQSSVDTDNSSDILDNHITLNDNHVNTSNDIYTIHDTCNYKRRYKVIFYTKIQVESIIFSINTKSK